jgi:peptidoglycan/LPS O-acetylase OafA/YrhL
VKPGNRLFSLPERRHDGQRTAYRPDIDGLRALAILSVMIFHAFPNLLRGGFIGVDIFFVISGFLISRIVFIGLANGNFSFFDFYVHRIRRIFPALILVLFAALILGWYAMLAVEYRALGKHVAGGIGFVNNILLWQEDSYFGTASELKPLMHLWSLGIEEQFYLFFPVLLVVLWRVRFSLWLAIAGMIILSFAANLYWMGFDAAGAFFLPHTRFWELLAGGLLAYGEVFKIGFRPSSGGGKLLAGLAARPAARSWVGLFLLVAGMFVINRGSSFPGYWALMPVFGAWLVIAAGPQAWVNRRVFANRGMVSVGLISYPLYLWHWPILSFLRILEARVPAVPIRIGALALTFVLSWLTYHYVERTLRFGTAARVKAVGLFVAGILLGAAGLFIYQRDGIPARPVEQRFGKYHEEVGHKAFFEEMGRFRACNFPGAPEIKGCWQTAPAEQRPTVAIIGDSHGADLFLGLATHLGKGENLVYFQAVCYPFIGIIGNDTCPAVVPAVDRIVADPGIRTVILSNYWAMRIRDKTIRLESEPENRNRVQIFEKLLTLTLEKLIRADKEVIFAVDVPDLDFPPEACLPSRPLAITERLPGKGCSISRASVEARAGGYLAAVERVLANFPQVKRWSPYRRLCNETDCLVASEGKLLYRDDNHLTPEAARWVTEDFWQSAMVGAPRAK